MQSSWGLGSGTVAALIFVTTYRSKVVGTSNSIRSRRPRHETTLAVF